MNQKHIFLLKHNWNNCKKGMTIKVNLLINNGKNRLLVIDNVHLLFFYHGNQAGLSEIKCKSRHCYTNLAYFYVHE